MQDLLHTTTKKFVRVCYSRNVEKSMCQLYRKADYDFSTFVVSQCLPHVKDWRCREVYTSVMSQKT